VVNHTPLMRDWLRLHMLIGLILVAGVVIVVAASHDTAIHLWEGRN
jgi:hypothetical protein